MFKRKKILCAFVLIFLFLIPVVFLYAAPIGTQSVDWSLMAEDGEAWQGDLGWSVYVVRSGRRIPLDADGTGGYNGCRPGETFYFSRTWDTDISQPVLRIHAVTAAVAVWADDILQYSDAPLEDAAVGTVTLPMLGRDRDAAVEVPFSDDIQGRTLTIAQASSEYSEKQDNSQTVYPCAVDVRASYGYERGIISEAYTVGLAAALLWLATLVLSALALWGRNRQLALLAALSWTRLLAVLLGAPFFSQYFRNLWIDGASLANQLTFTLMLAFLAVCCKLWRKGFWTFAAMSIVHGLCVAASLLTQVFGWQFNAMAALFYLPDRLAVLFLLVSLALCLVQARRQEEFFRLFLKFFAVGTALGLALFTAYLISHHVLWARICAGQLIIARFLREPILWLLHGALLAAVLILIYRKAAAMHERRVYDAVYAKAAIESYEGLKRHQEEVMLIRHETARHYTALRGLLAGGQTQRAADYLDGLLRQQSEISQVVSSENELINILLNSRIAAAEEAGISVELLHMNVPEVLPLSDSELVSLVLNILDNAIEAARDAGEKQGRLRIDMHCKNDYFFFSCENTVPATPGKAEGNGLNYHGYGQQLIQKIIAGHGNLVTVKQDAEWYSISIALPLKQ